jgi:signal transduction histidine kinase
MRHLYLQIYLAFVAGLLVFGAMVWTAWLLVPDRLHRPHLFEGGATVLARVLPAADAPISELVATLDELGEAFGAELTLRDGDGALLAAVGDVLPAPDPNRDESGWMHAPGRGPTVALHLPDGRWLIARTPPRRRGGWLGILALLAIAVAIGAYPVVRRMTRRLEHLQSRVDQLGAGDLAARVTVEGNDEVAKLARSFNRAADRVEELVEAQRTMLAGASHELRSPLTRIRMALELLEGDPRPELRERIARDIHELDDLIEELLLASRLNAGESLEDIEETDLLALGAEEGARVDARVSGTATSIRGDARNLRRMLRNLFENARRHGGGAAIEADIEPRDGGGARIRVEDAGPGVPESERERIFAPFYRPPGTREGDQPGSGLGLALVRQIARRHGGDARCLPRPGGGTLFEVTLGG